MLPAESLELTVKLFIPVVCVSMLVPLFTGPAHVVTPDRLSVQL